MCICYLRHPLRGNKNVNDLGANQVSRFLYVMNTSTSQALNIEFVALDETKQRLC